MSFLKKLPKLRKETSKLNGLKKSQSLEPLERAPNQLYDFVLPPDLIADAVIKSNRRSTSTVEALLPWARDYFSAFLKDENVEDLLTLYDKINVFVTKGVLNPSVLATTKSQQSLNTLRSECLEKLKIEIYNSSNVKSILEKHINFDELTYDDFVSVQDTLLNTLQKRYLPRFVESAHYAKCQIELFTNCQNISLYDILLNQNVLFHFMEYVDQEGQREILEFWLAANNFYEQCCQQEDVDVKLAQTDAMVLYERYVSLQASTPLGFKHEIRSEVERLLCSKNVAHCFDRAMVEAYAYLKVTCLEGFLKSSLFYSFLSDLCALSSGDRSSQTLDSNSTCSNGSTASKSSTSPRNARISSLPRCYRIKKLSMGRVNSLGKFEADDDLNLEVLRPGSTGLTNRVKKLMHLEEKEKEKEDLAEKVAAMIVNQVTSITLGTSDSKDSISTSCSQTDLK